MKNKLILWMTGVLVLVVALMILIVRLEPEGEGIPRAQAFKAAALLTASRQECLDVQEENQDSHFSDREQGNWFVKYMDYLYDLGWLDPEITPATLRSAQGLLTYREAAYLASQAGGKFRSRVGANRNNQDSPYPAKDWWILYQAMAQELDPEGKVETVEAVLYGTPSNLEDAQSWTAYTTEGDYGFEGLALDSYIDCRIRFLAREGEMITLSQVVSEDVVYENVLLARGPQENTLLAYLGSHSREFPTEGKLKDGSELVNQIVDLRVSSGKLTDIQVKTERINGKVLAVTDRYIELEGYGRMELAPNFHVYQIYGEFELLDLEDILVGYNLQDFVEEDGRLCAALVEREFDASTIRVLLKTTGFQDIFHDQVQMVLNCPAELEYETASGALKTEKLEEGSRLDIGPDHAWLEGGRMIIRPSQDQGITILSIERAQGNPVYTGTLEIAREDQGLVLVNDLDLEEYLIRVVPSEMPASYEMEALKAQAICARNYAWRQIEGNAYSQYGAHVDDSTSYQVYNNTDLYDSTTQAVRETYGQLLVYQEEPVQTYYFSTSCGHTTDGSVWGAAGAQLPYLQAVEVRERRGTLDLTDNQTFEAFIRDTSIPAYDSNFPMYRWETDIAASSLEARIEGIGQIENLRITSRGPGGIGREMVAEGTEGSRTFTGQTAIRQCLGSTDLKFQCRDGSTMTGQSSLPSAFIAIEKRQAADGSISFHIYGGGYGHGVGMSQNGAQGMARQGKTCEEILAFFYQGTQIQTLSGS